MGGGGGLWALFFFLLSRSRFAHPSIDIKRLKALAD
jgi:hypothetical protein